MLAFLWANMANAFQVMPKPKQPRPANAFRAPALKGNREGNRARAGQAANVFQPKRHKPPAPPSNVREALLEAVGQIIKERGIGFVSLREVARRAKVSHAAPAHYFRNKGGLFTAFAAQGYERLAKMVGEAMARSGAQDGPTSLELVGAGYVSFAVANPEHFTIMFRPASTLELDNADFLMAREAAFGVLTSTIQRCAREGFLEGMDAQLTAIAAWSIVHGLAALWLSGRLRERIQETDPEKIGKRVAKLFVDSVLRKRHARPNKK
jgi:AcrR family transcriptional regulator